MRYIDSLKLKETIECFILIEPGLGYIIPVLRERFKNGKIIALHIENHSHNDDSVENYAAGNAAICGAERSVVNKFLEKEVPEIDIDRIRVIEWRPSLNCYGEAYAALLSQVVEFLKRLAAGKRTTAAFGKRWIRNFFRNLEKVSKIILYRQTDLPVIVTGSGPRLEQALPAIAGMQNSCLIIAASSSVMALSSRGIKADIVITTDGGNWALKHLTVTRHYDAVLAANLCAALPSQTENSPFFVINDGSFWQSIVLSELAIPSIIIPQRGTVTSTAAELAMILSSGNIYLAGMDFSNSGIRTHVKPYAFDSIFFGRANRFMPVYTACFTRSELLKEGGSMNIYASWFKDQLSSWQKHGERIFSLTDSDIFKKAIPENPAKIKNTDKIFSAKNIKEDTALFYQRGIDALSSAMNNPEFADNVKNELTTLLFAEGAKNVTKDEILEELTKHRTVSNQE